LETDDISGGFAGNGEWDLPRKRAAKKFSVDLF
jgi:hypothetical protein